MGIVLSDQARANKLTDQDLRECLAEGLSQAAIARRFNCSRAAVNQRVKALRLTTAAAATLGPHESRRFTRNTIDAWEQLSRGLVKVNLLMDACHEWLLAADMQQDDPERYDVGPRAPEVDVTYRVAIRTENGEHYEKRKKKLSLLMANLMGADDDGARICEIEKGEYRHSDPRDLILKTAQEARQTIAVAADLARMLADARAMEALRDSILAEVAKVDRGTAERIAEAVRRSILLNAALGGPGALPAPGGDQ